LTRFRYLSPAKINLSLYVGPPAGGGYHPLRSLFDEINLCDEIIISPSNSSHSGVVAEGALIVNNTCSRVLAAMADVLKYKWQVKLNKRIPIGAGLGGGSSNAGTLINALCDIESLALPMVERVKIAASIGSDVPFFLHGGACDVSGVGDEIRPLQNFPAQYYVLIFPSVMCSTQIIYNGLDDAGKYDDLEALDHRSIFNFGYNRLASTVYHLFPQLNDIREKAVEVTQRPVFLSGSGSTLYILVDSLEKQIRAIDRLKEELSVPVVGALSGTGGRT
jgi:4-diphosphocytidyl-2-C-methyl-D-erythritol kinase